MYHKLLAASTLIFSLIRPAAAHAQMTYPPPRRSKHAPSGTYTEIDFDMMAPLEDGQYPCHGYARGSSSVLEIQAGSTLNTQFDIGEAHGGGHCQFSISCDGQNFAVFHTIERECLLNGNNIPVPIPSNIPNGHCIFAWTWINTTGLPEFYMNCADVTYVGGSGSSYTGHQPLVANLSGYPRGLSSELTQYLDKTPMNTIYGTGQTSNYQETSNVSYYESPQIQSVPQNENPNPLSGQTPTIDQTNHSGSVLTTSSQQYPPRTALTIDSSTDQFNNLLSTPSSCQPGTFKCDPSNPKAYFQCANGSFVPMSCNANLICQPTGQQIVCAYPM